MEQNELWVFGYGSLIWSPGFEVAEQALARLDGYWRSFCMWSIHHRGTEADPGLVLALDAHPEGYCDGVAFRVVPGAEERTLDYLRERELISSAYLERVVPVSLRDGRGVSAVTYVMDVEHPQYCQLPPEEQARVIASAHGGRGPNDEYLYNTVSHLDALGIADPDLDWLARRVAELKA